MHHQPCVADPICLALTGVELPQHSGSESRVADRRVGQPCPAGPDPKSLRAPRAASGPGVAWKKLLYDISHGCYYFLLLQYDNDGDMLRYDQHIT